jgi:4-coumarate--CoA ligase
MIYESAVPFGVTLDDLTIPQFTLDEFYPGRPQRPSHHPWLIDDKTGKKYNLEICRSRTHALANSLQSRYILSKPRYPCAQGIC